MGIRFIDDASAATPPPEKSTSTSKIRFIDNPINYDTSLAGRDARAKAYITDPAKKVASGLVDVAKKIPGMVYPELTTAIDVYNSPLGKKVQDLSAIPYQGLRGMAEGVGALTEGPGAALQKANEAVQPGYEPQTTKEKLIDFGTQMIEPRALAGTAMAAGPLKSQGVKAISKFSEMINDGLAKISKWKLGANVHEKAADIAKASKFKLPKGTPEEIERGVERLQKVLTDTKDKAGAVLNKAKSDIGIPTTIKEKEASLLSGKGVHGLGKEEINEQMAKMLDAKTPEELAYHIAKFKALQNSPEPDKLSKMLYRGTSNTDVPGPYKFFTEDPKLAATYGKNIEQRAIPSNVADLNNPEIAKQFIKTPVVSKSLGQIDPETLLKNMSNGELYNNFPPDVRHEILMRAKKAGYEGVITPFKDNQAVPSKLLNHYVIFDDAKPTNSQALQARLANALQDKIKQMVDFNKSGSEIEGILKKQYGDLGNIVTDNAVGLQGAKSEMAKALDVFNDLKSRLADPDKAGKAEQFLRNLFTGKSAANKDYLEQLAKLEHMSGQPVLSDLFKLFAGEAYSKVAGSPKLATAAAASLGTSLLHGNIPGAAVAAGYLGVQSPSAIKALGRANAEMAKKASKAISHKLANVGVTSGLVSLNNNKTLQDIRKQLRNQ